MTHQQLLLERNDILNNISNTNKLLEIANTVFNRNYLVDLHNHLRLNKSDLIRLK